ncbi:MAG: hypothetical protein U0795_14935 [Pirellulales bacterium]
MDGDNSGELRRPRGLSVLAVLMMISAGLFLMIVCLVLFDSKAEVAAGFAQRVMLMAVVIALLIGSGVGLWMGTVWGWVCGLLIVGYNFAWNTIPIVDGLTDNPREVVSSPEVVSSLIRFAVFGLLLIYLLLQPVMEYCRLGREKRSLGLILTGCAWFGFALLLMGR